MAAFVPVMKVKPTKGSDQIMGVSLDFSAAPGLRNDFVQRFKAIIADNGTGLGPLRIGVPQDSKRHDIAIWFDEPGEDNNGMIDAILWALARYVIQFSMTYETYHLDEHGDIVDEADEVAQRHASLMKLVPVTIA